MHQPQATVAAPATSPTPGSGEFPVEAPPKQVALAMDRLSHAGRLIADIRLGADRLLEALFVAADRLPHQSEKPLNLILKEEASMRQHLEDLRTVVTGLSFGDEGRKVSIGRRQRASVTLRPRLALKAFTDEKRRFFPHLEDDPCVEEFGVVKKQCISQASALNQRDELSENRTLSDVLICVESEAPNMKILTYQRLDWLKRASLLSLANENGLDLFKEQSFHSSNRLRMGSLGVVAADQIAVVELLVPSVFRAIISLHPASSISPDAVTFFSPDECITFFCTFHIPVQRSKDSPCFHLFNVATSLVSFCIWTAWPFSAM